MKSWRGWWQLLRPPNLFTAAADVIAGYLFAGGDITSWQIPSFLAFASICLYASGVVLNDVWDHLRDAETRPDRPIPAGAVTRKSAAIGGATLMAIGLLACSLVGGYVTWTGAALAISIVAYNRVFKTTPIAPVVMGLCRALNLTCGMATVATWPDAPHWFAAALLWLYVTSVTLFARRESSNAGTQHIRAGWIGASASIAGLAAMPLFLENTEPVYRILVGILFIAAVYNGRTAAQTGLPANIQRAVKRYILAIIVFDAVLVSASRGVTTAVYILPLLLPALLLARIKRTAHIT